MMQKPELLAPVGDFERLQAAVRFGADAVYLGSTEYGMRAASANFDFPLLEQATAYAHAHGVKVYLTCNTLPHSDEIDRLPAFLQQAARCGIDALIVTDLGVLHLAKHYAPDTEIHISTQAGVVNYLTASELYRMGAKRVVLARELSLNEIRVIRDKTPPELELECFVHGAMCMSFSGRCLISNYIVGRDANRGACAQPCRWGYYLVEEKRPGELHPVFEDEAGSYILNAKDLCMLEHLDKLVEAGISSLKIEGRAKSAYYVSVVTNAYRMALDDYLAHPKGWQLPDWLSEEVRKVSHRNYSTGFYFGRPEAGQHYETGGYIRSYDIVGIAERWENGVLYGKQRNKFSLGEMLELLEPGCRPRVLTVSDLRNGDGEPIPAAPHAEMAFSISCPDPVLPGAILRKQVF